MFKFHVLYRELPLQRVRINMLTCGCAQMALVSSLRFWELFKAIRDRLLLAIALIFLGRGRWRETALDVFDGFVSVPGAEG